MYISYFFGNDVEHIEGCNIPEMSFVFDSIELNTCSAQFCNSS